MNIFLQFIFVETPIPEYEEPISIATTTDFLLFFMLFSTFSKLTFVFFPEKKSIISFFKSHVSADHSFIRHITTSNFNFIIRRVISYDMLRSQYNFSTNPPPSFKQLEPQKHYAADVNQIK